MAMNAVETGKLPILALGDVIVQQLAMLALCFIACCSFAFLVQRLVRCCCCTLSSLQTGLCFLQMPVKPFTTSVGVGMQWGLCLVTLLRLFSQSSVPAFSCFLWVSLGCAFGTLDWRAVSSKASLSRNNCHFSSVML